MSQTTEKAKEAWHFILKDKLAVDTLQHAGFQQYYGLSPRAAEANMAHPQFTTDWTTGKRCVRRKQSLVCWEDESCSVTR